MSISSIETEIVFGKPNILPTDTEKAQTPEDKYLDILKVGIVNYNAALFLCRKNSDASMSRHKWIETAYDSNKIDELDRQSKSIAKSVLNIESHIKTEDLSEFVKRVSIENKLTETDKSDIFEQFKASIERVFLLKLGGHMISLIVGLIGGVILKLTLG